MKKLYLAYGSNINLEQMAFRCPDSKVVTTGTISDYELQFRQVATIEPKEGSEVPVLIWELGGQWTIVNNLDTKRRKEKRLK